MNRKVRFVIALAMIASMFAVPLSAAAQAYDYYPIATPEFEEVWERTDRPVAELVVARTWIWGPGGYTDLLVEEYAEGEGGEREVQYFDKSRMEMPTLGAADTEDQDSPWYITQGLLATELMSGNLQLGDDTFEQYSPSQRSAAGDPDDVTAPTYADMGAHIDTEARATGEVIVQFMARGGEITEDDDLAAYGVTDEYFDEVTGHNVASVFWDFMNSQSIVYEDGDYVEGDLFLNPFYAVGRPRTEAYWAWVKVDNVEQNVLIQCFERRCLTFTPDNPEGWEVESGNIGQHYYQWRYREIDRNGEPEPGISTIATNLQAPRSLTVADDALYVAEAGRAGDECVEIEEEGETFTVCFGPTSGVTRVADGEQARVVDGLPSWGDPADDVFVIGAHDVAVDDYGNLYVAIGFFAPPEERAIAGDLGNLFATLVRVDPEGNLEVIADLGDYEAAFNPDDGELETNPYSVAIDGDDLIVVDASGNSLLRVDQEGNIETIAVFPARPVPAPPDFPEDEIQMQSVPTNVVVGPDGNYYVSELTGFPFPPDEARVYRVTPAGEVDIYAEGFNLAIDLAFDSNGRLYVLELFRDPPAEEEDLTGEERGGLVRIETDGTLTELDIPAIRVPTGITVGPDDALYISNQGVVVGQEHVIRIDPGLLD